MTVTAETHGRLTLVAIDGGLNKDNVVEFRKGMNEYLQAGARWFILDFAHADNVDSLGLEAILWLMDSAEAAGGKVKAAELDKNLRKIFEMTRLDHKVQLSHSIHDAVKSFG